MARRPIWKGHLSFGLVMLPITLYTAESPRGDLGFTMLDERDHSRIRFKRVNEVTGEEVPWKQIVKGFELDDGEFVVVQPAELKKFQPRSAKVVEIKSFVDRAAIPIPFYQKPYHLEPHAGSQRPYAVLREALEKTGKAGLATVVIHSRMYIAALVPDGPVLVLNTLRYADELVSASEFDLPEGERFKPAKAELDMAEMLVDRMAGPWNPEKYHDQYEDKLRKFIEAKAAKGGAAPRAGEQVEIPRTYNILDMLKRSVEATAQSAPRAAKSRAKKRPPKTAHRKAG